MEKLSFNEQIEHSIKDNWDLDALSDYKGETFQYKDIARIIEKLHIIFEYSVAKNTAPQWALFRPQRAILSPGFTLLYSKIM